MRFLVDIQLPPVLAHWLIRRGHDACHAYELGLGQADDRELHAVAISQGRILVSKDEDFFVLAMRPGDRLGLLWLRIGNCRSKTLLTILETQWPAIVAAFEAGEQIVEVR